MRLFHNGAVPGRADGEGIKALLVVLGSISMALVVGFMALLLLLVVCGGFTALVVPHFDRLKEQPAAVRPHKQ